MINASLDIAVASMSLFCYMLFSVGFFRAGVFLYGPIDVSKITKQNKYSHEEKKTMDLLDISTVVSYLEGSALFF